MVERYALEETEAAAIEAIDEACHIKKPGRAPDQWMARQIFIARRKSLKSIHGQFWTKLKRIVADRQDDYEPGSPRHAGGDAVVAVAILAGDRQLWMTAKDVAVMMALLKLYSHGQRY